MHLLRSKKHIRIWMFFSLLAYMAQAVGLSVHKEVVNDKQGGPNEVSAPSFAKNAQAKSAALMPHCHSASQSHNQQSDNQIPAQDAVSGNQVADLIHSQDQSNQAHSCCSDGCKMSMCHPIGLSLSTSILVSPIFEPALKAHFEQGRVQKLVSSLYRPPNLG